MPFGNRIEALEVMRSSLLLGSIAGASGQVIVRGPRERLDSNRRVRWGAGETCIMSSRADALRQLESGLRMAAEAVAKLLPRNRRPRNPTRPPVVPDGTLTEIDRFRARAAARRCGLKVLKP